MWSDDEDAIAPVAALAKQFGFAPVKLGTRMTDFEDKPPPAVGAFWIKEEDYPALLQLFDDGDNMPSGWKEWLKMAEEMEQGLKAYGHAVLRVYIDPTTFPDWCAAHATSPGSTGRRKFVAAAVTERYGRQA
jgi:hypothetical protein